MNISQNHTTNSMKNFSNLSAEQVEKIALQLNHLLAEYDLHYQKMRNFHWNVYREQFFQLHAQFEAQYNRAKIQIDEIAERILTLQRRPVSNFSDYLYMATIAEEKETLRPRDMVEATLRDFDILIDRMNQVIKTADQANDSGTADMVTAFLKDMQKSHWMFRAYMREPILAS